MKFSLADRFRILTSRARVLLLDLEHSGTGFDLHFYSKSAVQDLRYIGMLEKKGCTLSSDGKEVLAQVWKEMPTRWVNILREHLDELVKIRRLDLPMKDKELLFNKKFKTIVKISRLRFDGVDYNGMRKQFDDEADEDMGKELTNSCKWVLCIIAGQPTREVPLAYLKKSWGWARAQAYFEEKEIITIDRSREVVQLTSYGEAIVDECCVERTEGVDSEENGEEEGG